MPTKQYNINLRTPGRPFLPELRIPKSGTQYMAYKDELVVALDYLGEGKWRNTNGAFVPESYVSEFDYLQEY